MANTPVKAHPIAANPAASLIAHVKTLRKEEAFIAGVYAEYEGLKALDDLLRDAGVLEDVQAIAAAAKEVGQ